MRLRILSLPLLVLLLFNLAGCNLPIPFLNAAQPTSVNPLQPTAGEPTIVFPATFTPIGPSPSAVIITATEMPTATLTSTSTITPVIQQLPTQTFTITPLIYTPTPPPTVTPIPVTVTNTPTVTTTPPTKTPTITITSAAMRPGVSVVAQRMSSPPTIDGDWNEWTTPQFPCTNVVFGSGNWTGAEDLSASFRIGYDDTNLYIAVKVVDDTYVQNLGGAGMWQGDSLEILLDTNVAGDFGSSALSSDDFQLGINPGVPNTSGTKNAYLWHPDSKAGARSFSIASQSAPGQYRVEAAIPWSTFGTTPTSGKHFGFAFSVSDDDDLHKNVQQSMVSNVGTRNSPFNPTKWGDLTLN